MDCLYCVVDLHAITTFQDPKELNSNILETTAAFLASGLDAKKSIISVSYTHLTLPTSDLV